MAINHDAFEECTSTFSQEKRALNPERIVVMVALVYDMCGWVCVCSQLSDRDLSCLKKII